VDFPQPDGPIRAVTLFLVICMEIFLRACSGLWEWDLKRLATNAVLIGREKGCNNEVNRELAMVVNRSHQKSIANFALSPFLDVWYYEGDVDEILEVFERSSRKDRESIQKVVKKHFIVHKSIQWKSSLSLYVEGGRSEMIHHFLCV
jgi:Uncharacterized protein conserved in bacteria (DUF2252)